MLQDKYSKKIKLTAVEISDISISLRESIKWYKENLKQAKPEEVKEVKESLEQVKRLQKRFQRLAVKIEKVVLDDIKNSREITSQIKNLCKP